MKRGHRRNLLLLFVLLVLHLVANGIWFRRDDLSLHTDTVPHLRSQLDYHQEIRHIFTESPNPEYFRNHFLALFHGGSNWGHVSYLPASLLFFLTGPSELVALLSLSLFLAILVASVYAITARMYDLDAALLAAVLVSLMPIIFAASRQYGLDLPFTAAATAGFACLWTTDFFRRRGPAIAAALLLAYGLLIKLQGIFFIAAPVLLYLLWSVAGQRGESRINRLEKIICFLLVSGGVSALWWARNASYLLTAFLNHFLLQYVAREKADVYAYSMMRDFGTIDWWIYYPAAILFSLSIPLTALFLWALTRIHRYGTRAALFLIAWFFIPLLIFQMGAAKQERYLMPIYPAAASLIAIAVTRIRNPSRRTITIGILVTLALVQSAVLSFLPTDALPLRETWIRRCMPDIWWHEPRFNNHRYAVDRLLTGDWAADPGIGGILADQNIIPQIVTQNTLEEMGYYVELANAKWQFELVAEYRPADLPPTFAPLPHFYRNAREVKVLLLFSHTPGPTQSRPATVGEIPGIRHTLHRIARLDGIHLNPPFDRWQRNRLLEILSTLHRDLLAYRIVDSVTLAPEYVTLFVAIQPPDQIPRTHFSSTERKQLRNPQYDPEHKTPE